MTLTTEPRASMLGDERLLFASDAVRAVDDVHAAAISVGASDIHLEPLSGGGRVRARVNGALRELRQVPAELYGAIVARIKVLAAMDTADRRRPQDGRYSFASAGTSVDARVASLPTISGEKLVIRLHDIHRRIPRLEQLGMHVDSARRYREALHRAFGFIVICGPTGSGKTTTAYASIAERNLHGQHICTIEDPVEVRIDGLAQVQVNQKAGVTFASALRSFLRSDPNVIMVGEMRDGETAAAAVSAALTGALVITTLHAGNAAQAVERLVELGVRREALAAGLSAIVGQRLVPAPNGRTGIFEVLATSAELQAVVGSDS